MYKTKKGAVDLTELAVGVIVLGVVVSVGATILINFRDSRVDSLPTYSVGNETLTTVTQSGEALSTNWLEGVTTVTNATGGETINSGNYTVTTDGNGFGTVVATSASNYNNTNWNVTYSVRNVSDPQYALPNNATNGLAEYGSWFTILVIVGVAAVVLALLFLAFGRNNGVGGGATF